MKNVEIGIIAQGPLPESRKKDDRTWAKKRKKTGPRIKPNQTKGPGDPKTPRIVCLAEQGDSGKTYICPGGNQKNPRKLKKKAPGFF